MPSRPLSSPYSKSSTAYGGNFSDKVFRVTHPFHPWFGLELELLTVRKNWGEERVIFTGPDGRVQSMPVAWTNLAPADPFVALANGRSLFRPADLLALAHLLRALAGQNDGGM
ncbi:MAG: hypothetical protein HPY71_15095 [Firmicutes bacterium]|nr:hypothetical protein [Bacillota bacterium]